MRLAELATFAADFVGSAAFQDVPFELMPGAAVSDAVFTPGGHRCWGGDICWFGLVVTSGQLYMKR